ncbi:MAG: hypothetical protein ACD_28C00178G0001 [uncultured bacterium]|nr:MAG: hypothetical protein ACD_28C00178G0001 [uncultured bacterium]
MAAAVGTTAYTDHSERGSTIFLTIGMQVQEIGRADIYPTNQTYNLVDEFTETIQGWLLNPAFTSRVDQMVGADVSFSFRKQERQNIVVTLQMGEEVDVVRASNAFIAALGQEIQTYNNSTNTPFVLALSSFTPYETQPQFKLNALVGLFLGLFLSLFGVLSFEYLRRRLSFAFQAESLWGSTAFLRLPHSFNSNDLKSKLLSRLPWGNEASILFLEMGKTGLFAFKESLESENSVTVRSYPETLSEITLLDFSSIFLFVRLGETPEEDLRQFRVMYGDHPSVYLVLIA